MMPTEEELEKDRLYHRARGELQIFINKLTTGNLNMTDEEYDKEKERLRQNYIRAEAARFGTGAA